MTAPSAAQLREKSILTALDNMIAKRQQAWRDAHLQSVDEWRNRCTLLQTALDESLGREEAATRTAAEREAVSNERFLSLKSSGEKLEGLLRDVVAERAMLLAKLNSRPASRDVEVQTVDSPDDVETESVLLMMSPSQQVPQPHPLYASLQNERLLWYLGIKGRLESSCTELAANPVTIKWSAAEAAQIAATVALVAHFGGDQRLVTVPTSLTEIRDGSLQLLSQLERAHGSDVWREVEWRRHEGGFQRMQRNHSDDESQQGWHVKYCSDNGWTQFARLPWRHLMRSLDIFRFVEASGRESLWAHILAGHLLCCAENAAILAPPASLESLLDSVMRQVPWVTVEDVGHSFSEPNSEDWHRTLSSGGGAIVMTRGTEVKGLVVNSSVLGKQLMFYVLFVSHEGEEWQLSGEWRSASAAFSDAVAQGWHYTQLRSDVSSLGDSLSAPPRRMSVQFAADLIVGEGTISLAVTTQCCVMESDCWVTLPPSDGEALNLPGRRLLAQAMPRGPAGTYVVQICCRTGTEGSPSRQKKAVVRSVVAVTLVLPAASADDVASIRFCTIPQIDANTGLYCEGVPLKGMMTVQRDGVDCIIKDGLVYLS